MYCSRCGRTCTCEPFNPRELRRTMHGKTPELQSLIDRIRQGEALSEEEILDLFFSVTTNDRQMAAVLYDYRLTSSVHDPTVASRSLLSDWELSANFFDGCVSVANCDVECSVCDLPKKYVRNKLG